MEIVRSVLFQVLARHHHVQPRGLLFVQYVRLFPSGKLHFDQQPHCVSVFRVVDFVLLIQACV
jgi:hypothetical protein